MEPSTCTISSATHGVDSVLVRRPEKAGIPVLVLEKGIQRQGGHRQGEDEGAYFMERIGVERDGQGIVMRRERTASSAPLAS